MNNLNSNNNSFNSNTNKKDEKSKNDINFRMQHFFDPNLLNSTEYKESKNKIIENDEERDKNDRNNFKDQINNRMNVFSNMNDLNQRRLPFNNNIRDYNITVDSNKDQFNERLSNYNHLSSNVIPDVNQQNSFNGTNFHSNFKDETNNRLQELSPLARNTSMPTERGGSEQNFRQNLRGDNLLGSKNDVNFQKQFTNSNEYQNEQQIYHENYNNSLRNNAMEVSYNSYDNDFYSDFSSENQNKEPVKINHEEQIKDFDYSMMNNKKKISDYKNDGINQLPNLMYENNMPMDTRQNYNFNNE